MTTTKNLAALLLGVIAAGLASLFIGVSAAHADGCVPLIPPGGTHPVGCGTGTAHHHVPTAKEKAWSKWSHNHRTFKAWSHNHKHFVKHHSHRTEVKAWNRYKHAHTYKWWSRHVWSKR